MESKPEALLPILNERRERYLKASRLLFLAFGTLVAFHFIIFEPYLTARAALVTAEREEAQFSALQRNTTKRVEAYEAMQPRLERTIEAELETMTEGIASDLERLTEMIAYSVPERMRPERFRDPWGDDGSMAMQVQMEESTEPLEPRLSIPGRVYARLGEVESWADIRETLQPIVQEQVIAVRFSDYNAAVQAAVERELDALAAAESWQPKDVSGLPETVARLWEQVETASERARERLSELSLSLPDDERWWWTTGGKAGLRELEFNRSALMLEEVRGELGYAALQASLAEQMAVLESTMAAVASAQEEIAEKFAAFEASIAQLLGPMDWLPLNLDDLVALMPLLVAVAFGGGTAWLLGKRRRYLQLLDTSMKRSGAVRDLAFSLELEHGPARVRLAAASGCVAAAIWAGYANLRLMGLERLEAEQASAAVVDGGVGYSALLNWGVGAALLAFGFWRGVRAAGR